MASSFAVGAICRRNSTVSRRGLRDLEERDPADRLDRLTERQRRNPDFAARCAEGENVDRSAGRPLQEMFSAAEDDAE
jgi:hypothetical protein